MELDNRKKRITQDPEIQKIINEPEPTEEVIEEKEEVEEVVVDEVEEKELPKVETSKEEVKQEPEEPSELEKIKQRYVESSKEALNLHFKNKQLVDTIDEASNLPEPTEDELRVYAKDNGVDYDYLDEFSKTLLRKTVLNERRFNKISETNKEAKNFQQWAEKVDNFIDSPEVVNKYPDLEDHAEDFRKFCLKKDRHGMVLEDLVGSFMYGLVNQPKKTNKGSILLSGGNGSVTEQKPLGIDEVESAKIRVSDPKEYRRLVKAGKVKIDI